MPESPLAVLGAGSWGTALALTLAYSNHPVRLWGHHPEHMRILCQERENRRYLPGYSFPDALEPVVDLSEALTAVEAVCLVVPSFAFSETLRHIQPLVSADLPILWGTKGMDAADHVLLSDEVGRLLGKRPMAVLSGPSFATEVAAKLPTAVTIAGNSADWIHRAASLFSASFFRVYESQDLVGAQVCGVVKNVLAIAAGISDGMGLGHNARSALITRGLAEMTRLCVAMGGLAETAVGLCGLGDLVLTCTGDLSRNRRFGLALGKGASVEAATRNIGQAVEGCHNVRQVYALWQEHQVRMPISKAVYQILHEDLDPHSALMQLMERAPQQD